MALGVSGFGCEDALTHLVNYVWPNIFETSPHVVNAVMESIEGMRVALGPSKVLQYCLQVSHWHLYKSLLVYTLQVHSPSRRVSSSFEVKRHPWAKWILCIQLTCVYFRTDTCAPPSNENLMFFIPGLQYWCENLSTPLLCIYLSRRLYNLIILWYLRCFAPLALCWQSLASHYRFASPCPNVILLDISRECFTRREKCEMSTGRFTTACILDLR